MAKPPDPFHEFVMELFGPMGPVSVRRMFGGAGVFKDGLMFGLLADDVIYLKTTRPCAQSWTSDGEAAGSFP